jgi:hypothetical protein
MVGERPRALKIDEGPTTAPPPPAAAELHAGL